MTRPASGVEFFTGDDRDTRTPHDDDYQRVPAGPADLEIGGTQVQVGT